MTDLFSGPFKGSIHETRIIRIHFPKEDVAVVDGEARLTGVTQTEAGTVLTNIRFTDVMIKESDKWLIADVRAYVIPPSPKKDRISIPNPNPHMPLTPLRFLHRISISFLA